MDVSDYRHHHYHHHHHHHSPPLLSGVTFEMGVARELPTLYLNQICKPAHEE
jgi:hypothetical protein